MFKILTKDKQTNARLGVLSTLHGKIETPSYVIVATHAEVKCLKPSDIKKTKTQVVIANTYHLWSDVTKAKSHKLKTKSFGSFVLNKLRTKLPTMTDSGGFQVFSLGFGKNRIGKILTTLNVVNPQVIHKRQSIKITDKGVYFKLDGHKRFLGPGLSMKIQDNLGADIIFAFDECTSPLDSFDYNKKALKRTHKWAKQCLQVHIKMSRLRQSYGKPSQMLFGIVQGGRFKSLRVKSAKYIASLPFDGIGIGGSFGKDEMAKTLGWIVPHLPKEKPRHLLGIGRIEDIFNGVEKRIDLFDCVIPTREARHGRLWTAKGHIDIKKSIYDNNHKIIEAGCKCPVCAKKISKRNINKLFKGNDKDKLKGQRYATLHNVWFFNNLLEDIRKSIAKSKFKEFKKKFLVNFK